MVSPFIVGSVAANMVMRRAASKSPRKGDATTVDSDVVFVEKPNEAASSPSSSTSVRRDGGSSFPIFRTAAAVATSSARVLSSKRLVTRPPEAVSEGEPPIKAGYLSKLSTGKWKRRRWHERWFVLMPGGILSYYKYETVSNRRQEAQDSFALHGSGALLSIQVDLPRGTPTPFCFAVTVGGTTLLVCADTEMDFREWTNAISSTINPETPELSHQPRLSVDDVIVDDDTDEVVCSSPLKVPVMASAMPVAISSPRPLDGMGFGTLAAANCIAAFLHYGTWPLVLVTVVVINVSLLWWCGHKDNNTSVAAVLASPYQEDGSPSSRSSLSTITEGPPPPKPVAGTINGAKAVAGCSVKQCQPEPAPYEVGCWAQLDATRFNVRKGPNYKRTKLKAPSESALLTLIATDAYRSDVKIDNIGSVVQLPDLPSADNRDILIINCQVPCYPPSNPLWGEQKTDGDGFNFVTYYVIPPAIRAKIEDPNPVEPAIKLFKAFMQDDNPMRDRLKAIGVVVNPAEQTLGRMEKHLLETYNGQPILTRPQHRFYRGDGYYEVDVDAHIFNFVARKGLSGVADHFGNMVVDFGFVLEGQEDDELPEQILGCVRLCKVDLKNAPRLA
ncbi:Aste57867_21993 [Aphanomyces stellatus]|uniref:Aste57867_21993 protein n=1 Tax=Aphanomyces stellatus TaxID=120398 RepID=A0A485LL25_9STRA|nr:hypothetical protein As57867_021924 [Aphanomyces stellatus]VFT98661.1 Aste57867_21993 [Aphanomyces stellatus]